jgi:hypothetical protein
MESIWLSAEAVEQFCGVARGRAISAWQLLLHYAAMYVPGQEPIGSTGGITLHGAKLISRDMTSARILGHDKTCTAPVQRGPQAVPWEGLGGREGGVWGGKGRAPPQPRSCRALRASSLYSRDARKG